MKIFMNYTKYASKIYTALMPASEPFISPLLHAFVTYGMVFRGIYR